MPCSGSERWHNRDRVTHSGCDMEGRDGEQEPGEEGKEVGHEGPIGIVKVLLSARNKWVARKGSKHHVYLFTTLLTPLLHGFTL